MRKRSSNRVSQLARPPIVEMVLDVDCDLGAHFDVVAAAPAAKRAYSQDYPIETKQYAEEFVIERLDEGTQVSSSPRAIQALRFSREDKTQLVQVRSSGYSFNRLAPYEGFDALLPEIERTWGIYRELVQPLAIKRVSLRYVNRIAVPHDERRVVLARYFKTGPRLPTKDLVSTGFLLQNNAVDSATNFDVVTVLASHGQASATEFAFLLDISVASNALMAVDDDDLLWQTLAQLRNLKNEVFRSTVTKQCMQLFR